MSDQPNFCPHCGTRNTSRSYLCEECGKLFESNTTDFLRRTDLSRQKSNEELRKIGEGAAQVGCMTGSCLIQLFILGAICTVAISFFSCVTGLFR